MRVFVLGAGASIHAGYPLAAEMGNRLAAWINTLPSEHPYRYYLKRVVDSYETLDNFEAILADLMTCAPDSPAAALKAERSLLLPNLQEAVREHFNWICSVPAPLYDGLARLLRPHDTIITFNYDLGIERALRATRLWHIETGYGFPIVNAERPQSVKVLKLHGSTNWRRLYFGGLTGPSFAVNGNSLGDRPVLSDLEYLDYPDSVDPLCPRLRTAPSSPAMIMPALPKHFYVETSFGQEWKEFWGNLWEQADHAIGNADELVVIGYSLPIADERARDMLLKTTNKCVRLSICCGSATVSIEQEFRDRGFSGIQEIASTFEGLLAVETARGEREAGASI